MRFLLSISLCLTAKLAVGQNFYDLDKIQDIRIYFSQPDWDYRMDTAKAGADGYLLADSVVVNGAAFKNCGVKYKGNSSYDAARAKNPLHIELDYQEDADYQGFTDIKLGNCWSDNSSVREPLNYAILRQYMDAPRGNFARVFINGAFYGLMNNAESIGKAFLRDRFASAGNAFVKCNPVSIGSGLGNGPNLGYLGSNVADYASKYELKSDSGWAELIGLCDTLNNHFEHFAAIADVDRFLWMLAFNNATVNLDSYTGAFRQNYYLYRADNGHWMPIVWDLNMCIGGFAVAGGNAGALTTANMPTMSHTLHKSESGWPLIFKLLNDPFYNKMYLAHLRTINEVNFAAGQYKALASELHDLIAADVAADTNRLAPVADFEAALTANTPGYNGAGTSPGIFPLMDARGAYLKNVLSAAPPALSGVELENADTLGQMATVRVTASNTTGVFLGFRYLKSDVFERVAMADDGAHGDGAAGDGVFGAALPLLSSDVQYYFYAENAQTGAFLPVRAEFEFFNIKPHLPVPGVGEVVINEILADNTAGTTDPNGQLEDWIELYNNTAADINLTGLFLSDNPDKLPKWPFPNGTTIPAGGYLIVWADEDSSQPGLHANFKLKASGEFVALATSDGRVLDSISFGAQLPDRSFGRFANGTGNFTEMPTTFAAENQLTSAAGDLPGNTVAFRVFPNPANGWARVAAEKHLPEAEIRLLDAQGRRVWSQQFQDFERTDLPVSGLPPGLYAVCVFSSGGPVGTAKIVVQ